MQPPTTGPPTMHHDHAADAGTAVLATLGGASAWGFLRALVACVYHAAPAWELVPPLLFGCAAVLTARANYLRARANSPVVAPMPRACIDRPDITREG